MLQCPGDMGEIPSENESYKPTVISLEIMIT
jgi:hypothetical protein